MQIAKDLKNLFYYLSASHLIKNAANIDSFFLQISTFKIFLHNVIVSGGLKYLIDVADTSVSILHNANLSYNLFYHIFRESPSLTLRYCSY